MKILFITLEWPENGRNLYTDLFYTFRDHGHQVTVIHPHEKRTNTETIYETTDGMKILHVKTGNITETRFIEESISLSFLNRQFNNAVNSYLSNEQFDLIICSTPTITFAPLIRHLKRRYHCKVYLLLKELWPLKMVENDAFKKGSFIWKIFRTFEMRMYFAADFIGCKSTAEVDYIRQENPFLNPEQIEVCSIFTEIPDASDLSQEISNNAHELSTENHLTESSYQTIIKHFI